MPSLLDVSAVAAFAHLLSIGKVVFNAISALTFIRLLSPKALLDSAIVFLPSYAFLHAAFGLSIEPKVFRTLLPFVNNIAHFIFQFFVLILLYTV